MIIERLRQASLQGRLRPLDYHFARRIYELGGEQPTLALAAALLSARVGAGDVCISLEMIRAEAAGYGLGDELATLTASPMLGKPGEQTPLILEADRLYLGRYWWYEQAVARALRERAVAIEPPAALEESLRRLFPGDDEGSGGQRAAAELAARRRLAIISGGPGTGKTHTVTAILALLSELSETPLRIALAAPTGKAAARLSESIRRAKPRIPCSDALRETIPEEARTLHRLLGLRPGRVEPRHNADNPLPVDLLVVDEASMIDLPMMARLLAALPPEARLILLGDKDQLASVEAGSVFADISAAEGLRDCVALLRHSYRFAGEEGIGRLAAAVNAGDARAALSLLHGPSADVGLFRAQDGALESTALAHYRAIFEADDAETALASMERFRILCAVRGGPHGVERLNRRIERALGRSGHYRGRPIMITRNDYAVGLFNGDIGILWPDAEAGGALRAWFIRPDGSVQRLPPSRLPEHESAYAMTIHKSQGSEFDQVLLVLPDEESELLSRELLYTGITRARQGVVIRAGDALLERCIHGRTRRLSGLMDKLHDGGLHPE